MTRCVQAKVGEIAAQKSARLDVAYPLWVGFVGEGIVNLVCGSSRDGSARVQVLYLDCFVPVPRGPSGLPSTSASPGAKYGGQEDAQRAQDDRKTAKELGSKQGNS